MNEPLRNALPAALLAAVALLTAGCQTNTSVREEGVILYQGGDYPAAAAKFQRATELLDSDYKSHYLLGLAQLKLGRPVAAQVSIERGLAVRFDDPALRADMLDALAEAYFQQGEARYDNLAAFLTSTAAERNASRDYLRQGKYLAKMGDADAARTALRKGAQFARPNDPSPYMAAADFYRALGDVPNELVSLKYAYYIDPKLPGLNDRIRALGTVPGPTVALEPPKPEVLR